MTQEDEHELHRLCDMLRSIGERLGGDTPWREALQKGGIALTVAFIHNLRPEVEHLFEQLGAPLSETDRAHLRSMGIDPDQP